MNLTLLDGALLGGLATIVVPTIIHLLSRRRARRVRFAPMELLLRSQKRTARSIRLRQLLLLLVRTIFIFAIAAAVLRPLLSDEPVAGNTTAPVVVVIAIDVSASMQARLDGRTAFDLARARASEAVNGLPEDVRVGLVTCDAEPRDLVVPGFERAAVVAALEALTVGAAWADVAACAERAASLATTAEVEGDGATTGERRVVIVSDFAAHGFSRGTANAVDAKGLRIDLLPAFDEAAPPNHGILDIEVTPGAQGLGVRFTAARYGGPDVEVAADLFVGEARGARLALPFSSGTPLERVFTAPNAPTLPTTTTTTAPANNDTITVALGDDALSLDNVVVLPNEERPAVTVLVVDGEPDAVPFADEVYYLTQALSSSRAGIAGQSRLTVNVLPPEKVDAASLVGVDVVVLANVARLSIPASAAVVSHVEAGGGLLLTMGDQVDVDAYNRELGAVLPAVLRGIKRQTLLDDASVSDVLGLARFKADHPILRAFAGSAADALPGLTRVRTTATMLVEPDPRAPREILARFTNDAPALMERAVGKNGQGRVLLLTTSIDREWTDLPIRPGFLPLVEQIVLYLGRALDDERPRTIRVGEVRALTLPAGSTAAVITRPDGTEVTIDADSTGLAASFTDTTRVGLHKVAVRDADGERTPLPRERFAVLVDPREVDLTRIKDDQLKASLPTGAVVRRTLGEHSGEPVWPWLLLLGVTALLVEAAMVRRSGSAG